MKSKKYILNKTQLIIKPYYSCRPQRLPSQL